ncbi:fibroblast growth factor receptor 2-like [Ptychodera flava]|uniref:fibroblast growth factor receptor 2-like n=1 Tax=Ptychodera flava TaxID=63121 RepID=UPI003969BB5A
MGRSNDDDHQEIPYHSIDFGKDITSGYFTKLVKAVVPSRDGGQMLACVKILRDTRGKLPEHCLLTEAKFMKTVHKRENILEMIYCCTIEKPYCLVFEYCSCGTLKHHLITNYNSTQILVEDNTLRDLYTFALQIARGMSYLEDIQCVHRALSSKTVHVDQGNICKITEFGMSSKVMTESTFETVTEGRLPIRWMALESIIDCIYTSKTDVWSYGVILWKFSI